MNTNYYTHMQSRNSQSFFWEILRILLSPKMDTELLTI